MQEKGCDRGKQSVREFTGSIIAEKKRKKMACGEAWTRHTQENRDKKGAVRPPEQAHIGVCSRSNLRLRRHCGGRLLGHVGHFVDGRLEVAHRRHPPHDHAEQRHGAGPEARHAPRKRRPAVPALSDGAEDVVLALPHETCDSLAAGKRRGCGGVGVPARHRDGPLPPRRCHAAQRSLHLRGHRVEHGRLRPPHVAARGAHGRTTRHPRSRLRQRKRLQRVVVDGRRVRPHQQPVDVERLLVCDDVVDDRLRPRLAQPHLRHLLHAPLRSDQRPGLQRTRLLPVPRRHRPRDVREQQHLAVCAGHRVVVRDVRRTAVQPHQPPRPKLRHVHEQHPRRLPGRRGQQVANLHVADRLPPAARQSSPRVAGEAAAAGVQPLLESI
eukprot:Rhum_TRINITY_DN15306_c4_g1::Rhum_TRINITY_DN15306_c4_g1_i6::g.150235::m.150235